MLRKLTRTAIGAVVVAALLALCAAPAGAAPNPNPIDWTVRRTIIGPRGEDLPLRVGQHDLGDVDGFGLRHIADGHGGFVPDPGLIEDAVHACRPDPTAEETAASVCHHTDARGRAFVVVYTERVDSRAPDGRPVGIITAYYA